jgi:site-specific recombinase XerC
MAQAKTLTKDELARVLDYIDTRRFAQRNRAMMLLTHLAGLRIGEVGEFFGGRCKFRTCDPCSVNAVLYP